MGSAGASGVETPTGGEWDAVVVGAGVAGSAVAYALGKQGRKVLCVERDLSQPDRIVGELLQPGGVRMLQELGLGHCVDGIDAQPVFGYAIFRDGKMTCIDYPTDEGGPAAPSVGGKIAGRSFHHGRFVQNLRHAAMAVEGITFAEGTVRGFVNVGMEDWKEGDAVGGVIYKPKGGEGSVRAKADLTIVCDGMYSTLRKKLTPEHKIDHPSYFVGVLLEGCDLPFPNHGHVILADPSPILFYPIGSGETRCLVDVSLPKLPSVSTGELHRHLLEKVAPQVPTDELREAFVAAVKGGRIRSMQNKQMPAEVFSQAGALMLGDAFNMRHPLTGGGMTVALHDSKLLCDMLKSLRTFGDRGQVSQATNSFHTSRKPWAATINTLANALYKVFCRTGAAWSEEMQRACFDYLSLGGMYSKGPISLLSGLNPRPTVLVMHFFMVALFGIGRLLSPFPTFKSLLLGFQLLMGACAIILPIISAEGVRAVFAPNLVSKPKTKGMEQVYKQKAL